MGALNRRRVSPGLGASEGGSSEGSGIAHGLMLGTGLTFDQRRANLERLRELVALAAGGTLYLPEGDIEIEIDSVSDLTTVSRNPTKKEVIGVYINHDIQIVGAGREYTRIQVYPRTSPQAFTFKAFYFDGFVTPRTVTLEDWSLVGSTVNPGDSDALQVFVSAVRHQGKPGAAVGNETMTMRSFGVRGHWHYAVESNEGDLLLEATECMFEASEITFGYYGNTVANKRLHLEKCTLYSFGDEGDNQTTHLYLSPCVSGRFVNCDFLGYTGIGLYWNGSSTSPAKYGIVDSCYFEPGGPGDSMPFAPLRWGIQAQFNGPLQVSNCRFDVNKSAIRLSSNVTEATITGCSFAIRDAETAISVNKGGTLAGKNIVISSCQFKGDGTSSGLIDCALNGNYIVSDCHFTLTAANRCIATHDASDVTIIGCTFTGPLNAIAVAHAPGSSAGSVKMIRCTVLGAMTGFRWNDATPSTSARAFLEGNDFASSGKPLALSVGASSLLRGSGNTMTGVISSGLTINTTTTYQRISIRQAINDATIASASAIVLDPSYDTHHLTGATPINNIYFVTSGDGGVSTKQFEGTVRLIADGAWALTAAGNIRPRILAARTVNEVVTLTFDPRTGLWYE
jgi:hypothetical protein